MMMHLAIDVHDASPRYYIPGVLVPIPKNPKSKLAPAEHADMRRFGHDGHRDEFATSTDGDELAQAGAFLARGNDAASLARNLVAEIRRARGRLDALMTASRVQAV